MSANTWVILLAGGDGRRLEGRSHDENGRPAPKQYCAFGTGRTLIARALDRALGLTSHERIVAVVSEAHRAWWSSALDVLPAENIVAQPENRGTAAGLLLPLLHVMQRDPGTVVAVLPSDHFVEDDAAFIAALEAAAAEARRIDDALVMIGMTPDSADGEYGWIEPEPATAATSNLVAAFVEKPTLAEAERLFDVGALWSTFTFCAWGAAIAALYEAALPWLLDEMGAAVAARDPRAVTGLYRSLDSSDFSRDVLQASARRLRVQAAPPCGWTDLGTPERLDRLSGAAAGEDRERRAA
jgi:mannose-1-phosphate guanylyltransferase